MTNANPQLPADNRYSPKEAYSLLGICYSTLKKYTALGMIEKSYREDGSSYYTGESINNFWLHKSTALTMNIQIRR